jgi:ABC-type multidrug transport system fused ATPase/permease subunit
MRIKCLVRYNIVIHMKNQIWYLSYLFFFSSFLSQCIHCSKHLNKSVLCAHIHSHTDSKLLLLLLLLLSISFLLLLYDDSQKSTLYFFFFFFCFYSSSFLHSRFAVLRIFIACREQIVERTATGMREIRSTCATRHCRSVCAVE